MYTLQGLQKVAYSVVHSKFPLWNPGRKLCLGGFSYKNTFKKFAPAAQFYFRGVFWGAATPLKQKI